MNEHRITRTDAMTVPCPFCHAPAGDACIGTRGKLRTSIHAERHLAYVTALRQAEVRRHPADLALWDAPAPYHEPAPPEPGTLEHPLDDDTRRRGLRHLHAIRHPPDPEPPW